MTARARSMTAASTDVTRRPFRPASTCQITDCRRCPIMSLSVRRGVALRRRARSMGKAMASRAILLAGGALVLAALSAGAASASAGGTNASVSGTFTAVDFPGATTTIAAGINKSREIVGTYIDSTGKIHGFTDRRGAFTTIDVPGALFTDALGVNDKGLIVGMYADG